MLPAWAIVVNAIGGSLVTALASEWRKLLVDVANDFSTGLGQAIRSIQDESRGGTVGNVDEALRMVAVVDDRLPRVLLLFGQDSKTGRAAAVAVDRLRASADELRQEHPVYAEQMCAEIEDKHAEFNRMARNAIPGRPYRFLGALRD